MLSKFYDGEHPIGLSVPATEHSVMCSYGREGEFKAFEQMLALYASGVVSIVSDTYNLWNVLTNFYTRLKPRILAREGKVVFRSDSGNPEHILCGDPNAPDNTPEGKGAIRLLEEQFGSTINSKGYRVLNPKVGLIYGDGFYYERFHEVLARMERMGYASSNLVVGIGGILLQKHNRDDQGFALKATYTEVDGVPQEIQKDPITDAKKKSHKGLMKLVREGPIYTTLDQMSWEEEGRGELQRVFRNGKLLKRYTLQEIRNRVQEFNDTRPPIRYPATQP
jgi:nicotinamide phosphoribosyltransferase